MNFTTFGGAHILDSSMISANHEVNPPLNIPAISEYEVSEIVPKQGK